MEIKTLARNGMLTSTLLHVYKKFYLQFPFLSPGNGIQLTAAVYTGTVMTAMIKVSKKDLKHVIEMYKIITVDVTVVPAPEGEYVIVRNCYNYNVNRPHEKKED